MKPLEVLAEAVLPDGTVMKLTRRGDEYLILVAGVPLMSSRMHGSEEALAELACPHPGALESPNVLIGGLGMGFTLRAALDLLPLHASVVVAELVPAVVEWNRGALGPLAGHPLSDERVRVEIGDVAKTLNSAHAQFDAIILDVDNGPADFTTPRNATLYGAQGLAATHRALKPGGLFAVWAVKHDPKFQQRLHAAGFAAQIHQVRGHTKNRGPRHIIYLARKSSG